MFTSRKSSLLGAGLLTLAGLEALASPPGEPAGQGGLEQKLAREILWMEPSALPKAREAFLLAELLAPEPEFQQDASEELSRLGEGVLREVVLYLEDLVEERVLVQAHLPRLIALLEDPDWLGRERATRILLAHRHACRSQLASFLSSASPELQQRLRRILGRADPAEDAASARIGPEAWVLMTAASIFRAARSAIPIHRDPNLPAEEAEESGPDWQKEWLPRFRKAAEGLSADGPKDLRAVAEDALRTVPPVVPRSGLGLALPSDLPSAQSASRADVLSEGPLRVPSGVTPDPSRRIAAERGDPMRELCGESSLDRILASWHFLAGAPGDRASLEEALFSGEPRRAFRAAWVLWRLGGEVRRGPAVAWPPTPAASAPISAGQTTWAPADLSLGQLTWALLWRGAAGRRHALVRMARRLDEPTVRFLLAIAARDPVEGIASNALSVAGASRIDPEDLLEHFRGDPRVLVRMSLLDALLKTEPEREREIFQDFLADPDPVIRRVCAERIFARHNPEYRELLEKLLEDPDPALRRAASTAIEHLDAASESAK